MPSGVATSSSSAVPGGIEPREADSKIGGGNSEFEIHEVIRRVRAGETFAAVACDLAPGLKPVAARVALYRFMLGGLGDEKYHDLVTELLVSRVAEADEKLEDAKDRVEVSKRKAIANFARVDFERRRPALYGPKQEMKHSGVAPSLHITIVEAAPGGRLIDGTQVPSPAGMLPPPKQNQGERDEQEGHRGQAGAAG